ncbi:plasmid mobilization relaxosome protein MobC [Steroidobacter flavus]|uniref:Plasmid mobilization relaxosome protein MobC n=1 Tax=Steroidobacter flavus TaxID=1842136 RepID=A0ABV8SVZ6_9GAMM
MRRTELRKINGLQASGRIAVFSSKLSLVLRRPLGDNVAMTTMRYLRTRVSAETKALVQSVAAQAYLTEAAWFRRTIDRALRGSGAVDAEIGLAAFRDRRSRSGLRRQSTRVYIRLRGDDRMILAERAAARGMPVATYASVLLRAHLRQLPPLPQAELAALKGTVVELGAIGRNLNQIAHAANVGRHPAMPERTDLEALLRVCEALRIHVKDLLNANLRSWAVGHAEDQR